MKCCVCGSTEETRPYGPGGKPICFPCAMTPGRKQETRRQFHAKLDAAGHVATIGTEAGPRPLRRRKERRP